MKNQVHRIALGRLLVIAGLVVATTGCQSGGNWFAQRAQKTTQFVSNAFSAPRFGKSKPNEVATDSTATEPIVELPGSVHPSDKPQLAEVRDGKVAERNGESDRAVALYQDALKKEPNNVEALHRLAVCHDRNGNHDEAGGLYFTALEIKPNDPEILTDLGYSLYLRGNHTGSERALHAAIAQRPISNRAHNNLGLLLARQGKHKQAMSEFMTAGCSEPEARANLIHAMMMEDRLDEALRQCELVRAQPSAPRHVVERVSQLQDVIVKAKASGPRKTDEFVQLARKSDTKQTRAVNYEAAVPANPIR